MPREANSLEAIEPFKLNPSLAISTRSGAFAKYGPQYIFSFLWTSPQFRGLVFIIPFEIFVVGAEDSFLGTDAVFVSSNRKIQRPKTVPCDSTFQRISLQLRAAVKFSTAGSDTPLNCLFVFCHNQIKAPFFCVFAPELVYFLEFIGRVDVNDRERDFAKKCLSHQPKQVNKSWV